MRIPLPSGRKRSRERYFEEAAAFTGHLSVEIDGVTFLVSTADPGVGEDVFSRGVRPETIVLPRAVQALGGGATGPCLVDVGANIGTTALTALLRFGFAEAVACEPSPVSTTLLRANCALNHVDGRVRIVEAAVSDEEGTIEFDVSSASPGTFQVVRQARAATTTTTVPAVTLDGLVDRGTIDPQRVGLLWIDAQGHEAHVLRGAQRLLAHRPPLVVAVRKVKLEWADGTESFCAALEQHYERLVDLRAPSLRERDWQPEVLPIAEIRAIVERGRTTDVLAF